MASMPLHSVMSAMACTKKMLFGKDAHVEHLIKEMVTYAETARRDGVLALESVAREAPDPFLRRGLQLTIDGTDPEIIERIMRIEIESMLERHKHGKHFWGTMAKFGPGCGLVACLVRPGRHVPEPRRRRRRDRQSTGRRADRHALRRLAAEMSSPARSPKSSVPRARKKRSARKSSCRAS